jgi:hypothetical protein
MLHKEAKKRGELQCHGEKFYRVANPRGLAAVFLPLILFICTLQTLQTLPVLNTEKIKYSFP